MERAALVEICWEMMDRTSMPKRSRSSRSVNGPTASITAFITGSAARRWRCAFWIAVGFKVYSFTPSITAENCSNAVCMSSTISCASTSGSGRSSESSRLLSFSQKISRFTLSRLAISS